MRLIFKPDSEIHALVNVVGWGVLHRVHQRRVCFVQGGDRGTGEVLLRVSQSVIFVVHTQRIFVVCMDCNQVLFIYIMCVGVSMICKLCYL